MTTVLPSGSVLRLRALEPSDVDTLYLWENSPEMWQFGFFMAPYSRHQLWEYIQNYDSDPLRSGQLRLMIDVDGAPVGSVDLYNIDTANSRAMVGVMIGKAHRRKGFARSALAIMERYAAGPLALSQLASVVAEDNASSLCLFENAGYALTATLPRWVRRAEGFIAARVFQKTLSGSTL